MAAKKKYVFREIQIKGFRSLLDIKISNSPNFPITICGENNIGKTNLLSAMDIFFNDPFREEKLFEPETDIPYHIYFGSRGGGTKTQIIGTFEEQGTGEPFKLSMTLKDGKAAIYKIKNKAATEEQAKKILSCFKYIKVEANNVNIPEVISEVLENGVLLPLDKLRGKNKTGPIQKLNEFIEESQKVVDKIEKEINKIFKATMANNTELSNKSLKIKFAKFEKLRDAIRDMTSVTLDDGNNLPIELKGSGAQRAVFITLMKFIASKSKKQVIWGLDEPEVFLQPSLQKTLFKNFKELCEKPSQSIFITTHSPHFIDLNKLRNTHLFVSTLDEKIFRRKNNQVFYKRDTKPAECGSASEKALLIKQHLGLESNDAWTIMPVNVVTEGYDDSMYFKTCMGLVGITPPNFLHAGGAGNVASYLQFFESFAKDLDFKPKFNCVFDEDASGREGKKKIKPEKFKNIEVRVIDLPRHDDKHQGNKKYEWEVEDFVPTAMLFKAVNTILRKADYSIILVAQRNNRNAIAYDKAGILDYCEACTTHNNSGKSFLKLTTLSQKLSICRTFGQLAEREPEKFKFKEKQISFLKALTL